MSFRKVIFLAIFPFLISSCENNKALATGDELVRNELCGKLVNYGDDSCEYIKEINLQSAVRREEYNDVTKNSTLEINKILAEWEAENNKKYMNRGIHIFHKTKRAPLEKNYGPDNVLHVFFWSVEVKDKKMLDVIFFSRSMHGQVVTSRQCNLDSNLNACLHKTVSEILENKVSAQIFNYRQYEILK